MDSAIHLSYNRSQDFKSDIQAASRLGYFVLSSRNINENYIISALFRFGNHGV